jgi:hypothetical protein
MSKTESGFPRESIRNLAGDEEENMSEEPDEALREYWEKVERMKRREELEQEEWEEERERKRQEERQRERDERDYYEDSE